MTSKEAVAHAIEAYQRAVGDPAGFSKTDREQLTREAVKERLLATEFLEPLRSDIMRGLSFVHDYKQINAQIAQNINVIIETRYTGDTFEEKMAKALRAEKAIYEAARFLEEKLNAAKFLLTPEWLDARDACARFRVHGLVYKYFKIYQSQFLAKGLNATLSGASILECTANAEACGVIPHTLLDNALKYSQRGAPVRVVVEDADLGVEVMVESFGPRLEPGEEEKIFWPFYRGRKAQEFADEGAGYGLYVSQLVAQRHLGVDLRVEQDGVERAGWGFRTRFSITFPARAKILE